MTVYTIARRICDSKFSGNVHAGARFLYLQEYRICAPGCVGTIPEYRRQGIGLGMVQNATQHIKELGYETVLRWKCKGFL